MPMQFSVFLPSAEPPPLEAWQRELTAAGFDIDLGSEFCPEADEDGTVCVLRAGVPFEFQYRVGDVDQAAPPEMREARYVAIVMPGFPDESVLIGTAMVAAALTKAGGGWMRNEASDETFSADEAIEYARWLTQDGSEPG